MNSIYQLMEEIKSISYIIEDETFSFFKHKIQLKISVELEKDSNYDIFNIVLYPDWSEEISNRGTNSYIVRKRFLSKILKSDQFKEYFDRVKEICKSDGFESSGTNNDGSEILIGFWKNKSSIIKEYYQFVQTFL